MAPDLIAVLRDIVGRRHLLTRPGATRPYATGYRFGGGSVLAVAVPASLVEMWRVAKACCDADAILIVQAANTGLTGGSTPRAEGYDRPVVILSTRRIRQVQLIDGGAQVVCLAGATLHELEARLAKVGREPHSVIGSSCIGASVVGGICNNSGGALVQRGPAFTQLALFARAAPEGGLELVNHLGIALGSEAEEILGRLERGAYGPEDVAHDPRLRASDAHYRDHVRRIDAATPARFNADPARLYEASGSAGRLIVFAVRLDSFPPDRDTQSFYVGTNLPEKLGRLRRDLLAGGGELPVSAEYMDRTAFDLADRYGKDMFAAILWFGTARLPLLFALKSRIERLARLAGAGASGLADRLLQAAGRLLPDLLPSRMRAFRDRFQHHLILKMPHGETETVRAYLAKHFSGTDAGFFECSRDEERKAFLHRFAVAGAAVRYRAVHRKEIADIVALDVALPRNAEDWTERLPENIDRRLVHKLYYGHFFCHVFHQDYLVAAGECPHETEAAILELLDARGAEYPAEHNVGHLYAAKPALTDFYRRLDPTNSFNPGIGCTPTGRHWSHNDTSG